MNNTEKMIDHIIKTLQKLNPEYVRMITVCTDALYKVQVEHGGE